MKKFVIAVAVVIMAAFAVPAFAAMNPFMDVPASHWAYDAVAQLAARGVISGYPDGSYKGAQPATRYEMASIVARALARVDMEKASKQDVDMLKKLIVEFKDELDALGVKVDKMDDRLKVIEGDIGGWSISGQLRFNANFGTSDSTSLYGASSKHQFDLNRYRMFFTRRINETTNFTARIGNDGGNLTWERYFVTTKLPYDITYTVGRANFDWEGDLNLYIGDDAYFGDWTGNMMQFARDWGMANLQLVIGRDSSGFVNADNAAASPYVATPAPTLADPTATENTDFDQFLIAGLANFNVNEKFRAGVMAYFWTTDTENPIDQRNAVGATTTRGSDTDLLTVGGYMGFAFTPSIELKGVYYWQDLGKTWHGYGTLDDNANAWKVILDVNQDALKFTSAWLEYGQIDNNFAKLVGTTHISFGSMGGPNAGLLDNRPYNNNSTKLYGIHMDQRWNDKWRTFIRYFAADYDTRGLDDAKNWTLGVGYRLNPAVEFVLAYDNIDYGSRNGIGAARYNHRMDNYKNGDDHMIRFQTFVTF